MDDLGFDNENEKEELIELQNIAKTIVRFKKYNSTRPRVMIITNSEKPVIIAVAKYKDTDEYSFTVPT